jgi:hypothetical protein
VAEAISRGADHDSTVTPSPPSASRRDPSMAPKICTSDVTASIAATSAKMCAARSSHELAFR